MAGINRLSERILSNAAAAIAGMARTYASFQPTPSSRLLIGATMFGVTTPCVTEARRYLEGRGYEVLVFQATGTGGQSLEALVRGGFLAGVLDITTTELADELVGGALDMVNFGPIETVPEKFRSRRLYKHNPTVTLMRTTPEECAALGHIIARKLNQARGPVALFIPLRGVSLIDTEGQPFYDPAADQALISALKADLRPHIEVHELDMDINDPRFAQAMARRLDELIQQQRPPASEQTDSGQAQTQQTQAPSEGGAVS
ncbi:Tm-1-like ATP-binding domain-containing protein [Thermogemmatispora tikiterensis]|nr:Tm-1-like ATP-binding domain-containing protein [Thermogemmatispora tikiterensis]